MIRGMIYLIAVIIVAGFFGIFLLDNKIPMNDEIKNGLSIEEELAANNNPENNLDETVLSPQQDSGGGSAGGGGGGGGEENPDLSCDTKQIAHSLRNFQVNHECTYNINGCNSMIASCSVEIHNLDSYSDGIFEMVITLINEDGNLGSTNIRKNVASLDGELFEANFNLNNDQGISENNLDCDFKLLEIPKVCV